MSNNNNFLLKYFFMCGVEEKIRDILKINAFKENNTISPVLLSSYSAEGKTELFEAIKDKIREDKYLKYNIFPKTADYLSNFTFPENLLDSPKLNLNSNPFNQYIKTMKSFDQVPEHFCHCFQYSFQIEENREDICLNFSVLLFYENVTDERDLYKEQYEGSWYRSFLYSKYYHTFVPKALILVSSKAIFSFMKNILEFLYKKYINIKYTYFPIEQIIINIFQKINNDNFEENLDLKMKYRIYKEPILPYCDLNISFFLKIFDLQDIFLIAEYYFCSKTIILACTKVEYLFPIYYIFMCLFFSLNINSKERFYKLLVPDEEILQRIIFTNIATFSFIYYNGNSLDENFLLNICQRKTDDVLLFELIEDPNSEEEYCFTKVKKILKTENDNLVKVDPSKYETIFPKVNALNRYILNDLIVLIKNDIKEINKYFDNNIKVPTFFYFSFRDSKYESLRNHFIGLFIKFFVINLNPIKFCQKDNIIEIEIMKPKIYKDNIVNELLDTLYSTPQSDLVYKNDIIKNLKFENKYLKKVILLDYFLKVSFMDKNREYFVPKLSNDENGNENKKIDLNELFDYKNIINDKKNIFYYINKLQLGMLKDKNKDNSIIDRALKFSKHIEYYEKLTIRDRKNEIDLINKKTSLKYMMFFGENLNLHFRQFVDKNIDISNNRNHGNKLDLTYNEKFNKYYNSILNEAEIFNDLYITQIIPIENREELAALAIGLYISIYIINLLSELEPQNEYNAQLLQIIAKKKEKLYKLFEKTKGFYGKFDFLLTLLFQIVFYHQSNEDYTKYTNLFLKKLEEENILLPIIIILMYNDNISLDFNKIKKIKEKKESIKDNNNYEPIKEILIYNIERNYHEHNYDIMNGINNNYLCENEECSDVLSFSIKQSENGDKKFNLVINPKYLIIKLLKKITDNNSLFIHTYNDINDIYEIAMLDELYFKIGFFQIPEEKKDSFNIL